MAKVNGYDAAGERLIPCRNHNGDCSNCTANYCSNYLRRPPCYDAEILQAQIAKYRRIAKVEGRS